MRKFRIMILITVALILLLLGLKLWHQKREKEWQAVLAESKKQDEIRIAEFGRKMDAFQAQGLISNAGALKSEVGTYYNSGKWNGPSKVILLAEERYERSPVAGLMLFEELCRVFNYNAEMSEWISEDFNTFAFKDRERFIKAVAGQDPSSFNCLPGYFDLSWAEGVPEDFQSENEKFLSFLQASSLKENPNIKKLSAQLKYLKK